MCVCVCGLLSIFGLLFYTVNKNKFILKNRFLKRIPLAQLYIFNKGNPPRY